MAQPEKANWLMTAEHIGIECPDRIEDLDTPLWRSYDVLTHTPPDPKWTEALHQRGIRSMPYMNLGYEVAIDAATGENISCYELGETPEFAVVDQLGRPQLHPNYLRNNGKLVYESCHNVESARDLYLRGAEEILKCGADGIFLDNAAPSRKCWGPKFGKHQHIYTNGPEAPAHGHRGYCWSKAERKYGLERAIADEEQTYASAMLLRDLRELARSFGPDKCLMINAGDGSATPPIFFEQVDSVMNEMFMYTTYLDCSSLPPTHLDFQDHDVLDWLSVLEWEDEFHRRGVRMANLPSFSPLDPNRKRHAFFAFCIAKLWNGLFYTTTDEELDVWLRDIRLGEPLRDRPSSWGAVLYREYENGLVAANPYGIAQQAFVPWTNKPNDVVFRRDFHELEVNCVTVKPDSDGMIGVKLPPDKAALVVPRAA